MPLCESNKNVISEVHQGTNLLEFMDGKLIKEDVLPCLSRAGDSFRVYLTSTELLLQSLKQSQHTERFQLDDLFGCHILKHKKKKTETAAYLCFYFYPKSKRSGLLSNVKCRVKVPLVFLVQKPGKNFTQNLEYASTWKEEVLKLLHKKFPKWTNQLTSQRLSSCNSNIIHDNNSINENTTSVNSIKVSPSSSTPSLVFPNSTTKQEPELSIALASFHLLQRRLLVILNPKSGQGKTISIFRLQVAPIFQEAGIKAELFITQRAGHANSFVSQDLCFNNIHGIVTIGGDGLLFEVVNGLRLRPDAAAIANIPVGVIAGGSGNGLARSIAAYSDESMDYLKNPVLSNTLAIARGKVLAVNITEVDLDDTRMYSFLSAGWGLLADIDVESEVLRVIGEPRFTLWSFLRLMKLNKYKAKLSYIPSTDPAPSGMNSNSNMSNGHFESTSTFSSSASSESQEVVIEGDFLCVYSACQSYIGSDLIFAPKATACDNQINLCYIRGDGGRVCATQFLLGLDKGSHVSVNGVTHKTVREFSLSSVSPGGIGGNLTIDGEKFSASKLTCRICPTPLSVFAL